MTRKQLMEIAVDATNDAELTSKDIPVIDLYVDQIINLIASKLEEGSERNKNRQLTKTMINNYSKDNIIMPVKGKKYTREQIIQILYIYSLKNTLSIGEIKRLLHGAYDIEGFDAKQLTNLYDTHQETKNTTREQALAFLNDNVLDSLSLNAENDADYISIICALVSMSAHLKNIAQAMIDVKFPEPVEEDDEDKKEKSKEKEKEKSKEEKEKNKEEKAKKKEKKKEESSAVSN